MSEDRITTREVLSLIRDELHDVKADISKLDVKMDGQYVSKDLFDSVEKRVGKLEKALNSVAGFIIFAVISALLGLVLI